MAPSKKLRCFFDHTWISSTRRQAKKSHRILTGTFVCVSCTSVLTKHIPDPFAGRCPSLLLTIRRRRLKKMVHPVQAYFRSWLFLGCVGLRRRKMYVSNGGSSAVEKWGTQVSPPARSTSRSPPGVSFPRCSAPSRPYIPPSAAPPVNPHRK